MPITAQNVSKKATAKVGDTVIFTNDMNPPANSPFQLGRGYTVTNVLSSGVEVEGHDQLMYHFEYAAL